MSVSEHEQLLAWAKAALRDGKRKEAQDALMQIVEEDQYHEDAWLWLANAMETEDERRTCLENVLVINPENRAAQQALAALDRPAPAPPKAPRTVFKTDTDQQIEEAETALREGNRTLAVDILQQVIRDDYTNVMAWLLYYNAQSDPAQRLNALEQALFLEPDNDYAQQQLQQYERDQIAQAKALILKGERKPAYDILKRLVDRNQYIAEAWLWLSLAVERPDDQEIALENVLTLEPDNMTAQQALTHLQTVQKRQQSDELVHFAREAMNDGAWPDAGAALREAVAVDARNARAWMWLSTLLDTHDERIACLEQVVALEPTNTAAQAALSTLRGTAPTVKPLAQVLDSGEHVKSAEAALAANNTLGALHHLAAALERQPLLRLLGSTQALAERITGLPAEDVLAALRDSVKQQRLFKAFTPRPRNARARILYDLNRLRPWQIVAVAGLLMTMIVGVLLFVQQSAAVRMGLFFVAVLATLVPLHRYTRPSSPAGPHLPLIAVTYGFTIMVCTLFLQSYPAALFVTLTLLINIYAGFLWLPGRHTGWWHGVPGYLLQTLLVITVMQLGIGYGLAGGQSSPFVLTFPSFVGLGNALGGLWANVVLTLETVWASITQLPTGGTVLITAVIVVIGLVTISIITVRSERDLIEERLTSSSTDFSLNLDIQEEEEERVSIRDRALISINEAIEDRNWVRSIAQLMRRANLKLTVAEYAALRFIAAILGFFGVYFLLPPGQLTVAFFAGVFGFYLPAIIINAIANRRVDRFMRQLPDLLVAWSGLLTSGQSVLTALEELQRNFDDPVATELRRVILDLQIGAEFDQTLQSLYERMPSEPLLAAVTAVQVQREVGGNLANILYGIAEDITSRDQIVQEARAGLQPFYRLIFALLVFVLGVTANLGGSPDNGFLYAGIGLISVALLLNANALQRLRARYQEVRYERSRFPVWVVDALLLLLGLGVLYFTGAAPLAMWWVVFVGLAMASPYPLFTGLLSIPVFVGINLDHLIAAGLLQAVTIPYAFPDLSLPPFLVSVAQGLDRFISGVLIATFPELMAESAPAASPKTELDGGFGLLIWLGIVMGFALIVSLVYIGFRENQERDPLQERLAEFGERETLSIDEIEMSLSFRDRVLLPILSGFAALLARLTPEHQINHIQLMVDRAGPDVQIAPVMYLLSRLLITISMAVLGFYVFFVQQPLPSPELALGLIIALTVIGYMLPSLWLRYHQARYQRNIIQEMPSALQIMRISVDAGLSIDGAMGKVYEIIDGDISLTMGRAIREIQLGKGRRESLYDMARRVNLQFFNGFVSLLISSEESKTSYAQIISRQLNQLYAEALKQLKGQIARVRFQADVSLYFLLLPGMILWLSAIINR